MFRSMTFDYFFKILSKIIYVFFTGLVHFGFSSHNYLNSTDTPDVLNIVFYLVGDVQAQDSIENIFYRMQSKNVCVKKVICSLFQRHFNALLPPLTLSRNKCITADPPLLSSLFRLSGVDR